MRLLLVKTSSLGDVVHNLPVVTDLRQRYPDALIDWVVEEGFSDLPRLHPAIRQVIPMALRRWRRHLTQSQTWQEIRRFRRRLQAEAYDAVLDTQGLIKSALVARQARLSAAGQRFGQDRASLREPLAACFYDQTFTVPRQAHAVDRNRQLAALAFASDATAPLDYGISADPLRSPWLPAHPYAVFLTGTSRADKLWPEADWQAVGQALSARGVTAVLPSGSAIEHLRAERIAASIPGTIVAPPLPITDLAGLFSGARLVIGLDTGLSHLAAALGKPTLALFSGSDPTLTGVKAGPLAINLGQQGLPPTAASVIAHGEALLS